MGKQADIEPRWLVSLFCQWARRDADLRDGGLGYPSKSSFLTIGVAANARTDPTEFSSREFVELDAAMKDRLAKSREQWAAITMYYRPWTVEKLRAEGWPFANSTYYARLHLGHKRVAEYIEDHRPKPEAKFVYVGVDAANELE